VHPLDVGIAAKTHKKRTRGDNGTITAGRTVLPGAIPWPMQQVHVDVVGAHFSQRRLYGLRRRKEPEVCRPDLRLQEQLAAAGRLPDNDLLLRALVVISVSRGGPEGMIVEEGFVYEVLVAVLPS